MESSVTDAVDFDSVCPDCTCCFPGVRGDCPECGRERPADGWLALASAPHAYLGQVVDGRYRLDQFLGGGGAGDVYRARDMRLDRPMALKVLDVSQSTSDEEMTHIKRRFENEVEALSRIRNPHVINIHEALTLEGGIPAMLTEYVEGRTLGEIIDAADEIELKSALVLVHQIANGLHEAHLRGVIHRDIKPDNIIVERLPASGWFARLLDFGLVHIVDSRRQTKGFHGTPLYAAPEQCRSGTEITAAADIYSLGCLVFHLVAGRPPFDYRDARALIFAQVDEEAPRLSAIADRSIPDRLDELVAAMLEKDPADRPPDLSQVVHLLERLIERVKGIQSSVSVETQNDLGATVRDRQGASFGLSGNDSIAESVAEEAPKTRRLAQLVQFVDLGDRFDGVRPPLVATTIDGAGDCAAVSDDGGGVYAMSVRGEEYCQQYAPIDDRVSALAACARSGALYGASEAGTILRWDLALPDAEPQLLHEVGRFPVALAVGPSGQKLFWVTDAGHLWEYDVRLERAVDCGELPAEPTHLAAGTDGRRVVTAGSDGEIWVIDTPVSEMECRRLAALEGAAAALHFDHPAHAILVASEEGDFHGGRIDDEELQRLDSSVASIRDVGVTADFQIIGIGVRGSSVQSWRLRYEKFERRMEWFDREVSNAGSLPKDFVL